MGGFLLVTEGGFFFLTADTRALLAQLRSLESLCAHVEQEGHRYVAMNLAPLRNAGTVEFRLHNGSTDARKVLLWLSLLQQLLWAADVRTVIEEVEKRPVIVPDGDIVALARRYLPEITQPEQAALVAELDRRRLQVAQRWEEEPSLQAWRRFARRWS